MTEILFILGIYLPADKKIDNYVNELNILDSLYTYYSNYGSVIVAFDLNASCIPNDLVHSIRVKSRELLSFIDRNNISHFGYDIKFNRPRFTYITKRTMLDNILIVKLIKNQLV